MTDIIFASYAFITSIGQHADGGSTNFIQGGCFLGIGMVFIVMSVIILKLAICTDMDRYSLRKNKIVFMINKKVNKYSKKGQEYVL